MSFGKLSKADRQAVEASRLVPSKVPKALIYEHWTGKDFDVVVREDARVLTRGRKLCCWVSGTCWDCALAAFGDHLKDNPCFQVREV